MNKKDIRRTTNPQSAIRNPQSKNPQSKNPQSKNPQSKNPQSVLVACIGNIFHGDDAFGVEVARRLAERKFPDGVRVVDFGIRGFDLAFALMDGYDVTIFVDATPRGKEPGTLYVIEPDLSELEKQDTQSAMVDTHGMNPMRVLNMARSMGAQFKRLLVVGCEPETLGDEEEGLMGLSEPVQAAVERAIDLIESLISKEIDEHRFVGQSASLSTT